MVSMKDAELSTLQSSLDAEKLRSTTLQSKAEQLELELSTTKDELRAKYEEIRLLHNDVVDSKVSTSCLRNWTF